MLILVGYVAAGGAIGAVLRFGIGRLATETGLPAPWGTFLVNVVGSFAIGAVIAQFADSLWFREQGRALIVVGVLGGFTTFSAFSLETVLLVKENQWPTALAYVVGSVTVCVAAAWAGHSLTSMGNT